MNLVSVMEQFNVKSLIFSSSATVYGTPQYLPLDEVCTPQYLPLNPLRGSTPGPWTPQGLYPEPLKVFTPRPSQGLCSWTHSGALRLRGCTAEPLRDSTPGPHQGLDPLRAVPLDPSGAVPLDPSGAVSPQATRGMILEYCACGKHAKFRTLAAALFLSDRKVLQRFIEKWLLINFLSDISPFR